MSEWIPEYSIPKDLENVLDKKKPSSFHSFQNYANILEALKNVERVDIEEKPYLDLLKLALYLEDYEKNKEMKKYELSKQTIKKLESPEVDPQFPLFCITTSGFEEERYWIYPNDFVDVIDTSNGTLYTLRITNVTHTEIFANDDDGSLYVNHTMETLYDIKFRSQNYPTRCAQYAVELMADRKTVTYLFPDKHKSYMQEENHDCSTFTAINSDIETNPEQKQAVLNIVNKSAFPAPYILYGPPGTGKTATLVEAMCQIYYGSLDSHILVCTPSNTAADEITRILLTHIPSTGIYRMYSQSRDISTIDWRILLCCNIEDDTIVSPKIENLIEKRIVISTLCNAIRLISMNIQSDHFSHVFIDESGQGKEPDLLIPISLVSEGGELNSQIVFAGDPQQLGPIVISKLAETILGRSILERLMSYDVYRKDCNNKYNPKYITKLLINYRSHPDIIRISNKLFYETELTTKHTTSSGIEMFPIIFHGVEGNERKYPYSTSICNFEEINIVIEYVDSLLEDGLGFGRVKAKEIGIVTPFTLQSKKIKKALKDKRIKDINVGTVELFQGQERKVMIMTTVRSKTFVHKGKEHIGFLSNPKRFNVAITRAKDLLIIIGNPNVLQIDDKWRYLLKYCIDNDSYQGIDFTCDEEKDNETEASNVSTMIKTSTLFDTNQLNMFKIDEYNRKINSMEIWNSLLDSPYKSFVSPMEYECTYRSGNNDMDDDCDSKSVLDQGEPKSLDVFKNVDYFDVNQLT